MASKESAVTTLSKNIRLLLGKRTPNALAKEKKSLKQRTLNNMVNPPSASYAPRLDNVEAVAKALRMEVWELLLPDLATHLAGLREKFVELEVTEPPRKQALKK